MALSIRLIGVPMDLGVTNRSGARFGPRAVRGIERVGPYNHALDVLPFAVQRCADIGDVPFRSRYDLTKCIEDIEAFYRNVIAAGVRPSNKVDVGRLSRRQRTELRDALRSVKNVAPMVRDLIFTEPHAP